MFDNQRRKMGKRKYQRAEFAIGEEGTFADVPARTWLWCCVACALIAALVVGIIALVLATPVLWTQEDDGTILSAQGDVEIRNGSKFIVHDDILHSGNHTMLQKIDFSPVFPIGPDGYNFIFGDQAVPYARVQARFAIGFRLGEDSFLSPDNFLFGEDGLKFLISTLGVHVNSVFVPFFGVFVPSDERIKTNVTNMNTTQALQNVLSLRPRTYRYTEEWYAALGENTEEERGEDRRGFVAQEVEDILPHSVRSTTMSLNGELVDDFRDLRKEDIVTEVVGALHEIHYNRIIETAYNTLMFADLQAQIDQQKDQPPWIPLLQDCTRVVLDPQDRALCICTMIDALPCVGISTGLCDPNHPLVFQCSLG